MGGDWRIERDRLERFTDQVFERPAPEDLVAELASLAPEDLASALEVGLRRRGADSTSAAALEAAYRELCARHAAPGPRRAQLVALIEEPREADDDSKVVRRLRRIEPSLVDIDESRILDAWRRAIRSRGRSTRRAARLSLDLDMFGDRGRLLPDGADRPALMAAITKAEKAFDSACRRHPAR